MLLPLRTKNPPESFPFGTLLIMIANIGVYAGTTNGLEIKEEALRQWGVSANNFDVVHVFSAMFLHADIMHLLGNMFFLYLMGFAVEGRLRTPKFVILYLLAGVTGTLLHHVTVGHMHPDLPSLGASGAIMGVMGAALYIFPHSKVTMLYGFFYSFGVADWPMWGVALYYLGFDALFALVGAMDGVGHFAHLGGALGGFLIALALRPKRDSVEASEAKATLSQTKDLQTLTRMELETLHQSSPNDPYIVLNWMHRSIRDPGGVRPNCFAAFQKMLPQMIREMEPGPVAYCLATVPTPDGAVPTVYYLDLAARLERLGDNQLAMQMYDRVLRDTSARQDDLDCAGFRMAMMCESVFLNYGRALNAYKSVVDRSPMGPFSEQARSRIAYLQTRVIPSQTI